MSYQATFVGDLSAGSDGATVHGQLYDSNGDPDGAAITTGIVELMTGGFMYVAMLADGYIGAFVMYEDGDTTNRVLFSINPREIENSDTKTSTRSSHSAGDVDTQLSGTHGASSWATATGFSTHSAGDVVAAMQAVSDDFKADVSALATSSAVATVDSLVDAIKAVTDLLPDGGALTTLLSSVSAILADTDELQGDWEDGGRLDLILDTVNTNVDSALTAVSSLPDADAIVTAIMAYAVETGHDVEMILQALYAVIRGKSVADDENTPGSVAYYAPDNSTVRVTHTLDGVDRTVA